MATTPNHTGQIAALRDRSEDATNTYALEDGLAADLLELHDNTGISLDKWANARAFVEQRIGESITENGA